MEWEWIYTDVEDNLSFYFVWAVSPVIANGGYSSCNVFLSFSSCMFSTRLPAFPFSLALQGCLSFFWVSGLFWEVGGYLRKTMRLVSKGWWRKYIADLNSEKVLEDITCCCTAFWFTIDVRFLKTVTDGAQTVSKRYFNCTVVCGNLFT